MCLIENAAPLPLLRRTCDDTHMYGVLVLLKMMRCNSKPTLAPIRSAYFHWGLLLVCFPSMSGDCERSELFFCLMLVLFSSWVSFAVSQTFFRSLPPSVNPPPPPHPPSILFSTFLSPCSRRGHTLRPSWSLFARTFLQEHPLEGADVSYEDVDDREGRQWWQCVFCSPDVSSPFAVTRAMGSYGVS